MSTTEFDDTSIYERQHSYSEPPAENAEHPLFETFKERVLRNPAVRAAYERARASDVPLSLDKRQARRYRRRMNTPPANEGGQSDA